MTDKLTIMGNDDRDWSLPSAVLVFIVMVLCAVPARAEVNLLQTDAAVAFKAKEYERAATEFSKLVAENPEDITLLRYLGITLRKLKKYHEALDVFQNALTREPTNVAVNYHTAFTFYKAGELQAAQVAFNTVVVLAPGSKYAGLARQYMDAISERLARGQSPVDPKRFGIYGQLTGQYDSNVLATPCQ